MQTINLFTLESKIHFSNGCYTYNADGMICDLDVAEYIDVVYDNSTDEFKKVADNEYQLISAS